MIPRISKICCETHDLPPWFNFALVGAGFLVAIIFAALWEPAPMPHLKVAFIGNSMMYYNDMPRFMEELSDRHIEQQSCLHGGASFNSMLLSGNGMYNIWQTGSSRIYEVDGSIHDYGACTVEQLLFGYDANLEEKVEQGDNDDGEINYADDFVSYYDGRNPCFQTDTYYEYLQEQYEKNGPPEFDFIIMNDNTRAPARYESRQDSLQVLEEVYAPWIAQSGATPVLIFTYGYWTPYRDMGGLDNVPVFSSFTYEGYKQYAATLEALLPEQQKPRISPVGMGFLLVYEEDFNFWQRLFHVDQVHPSPLGTFLEGCILHHTLFGRLPKVDVAVRSDMFDGLWLRARRFQPRKQRRTPFPTPDEAAYLYHIASRVCIHGHVPRTLQEFDNGEATTYEPNDEAYKVDDLY